MNFLNNIEPRDDLDLKQDNSHQKPTHESTTTSINDESQKNFIETNIYYSNNINNNYSINMELQNDNEDIFPPERLGGDFKFMNDERNSYSMLNNQLSSNIIDNIFEKNRNIIMKEDIPEMLLYKYNYDVNLLKESIVDINNESQWLFDFLNVGKSLKGNYSEERSIEVKQCLKNLLTEHKLKKLDIPYIIINHQDLYDKYFSQSEVFEILSVYDVEFLRLQKKRKRINNIFNYISQKKDSILNKEIENYFKIEYITNAKNESELDIIEIQLDILAYVYQSNEIDENLEKLFNSKILSNLNIDFNSLSKVKENKLYDIIKKFCLTPEQVAYNLKILTGEDKVNSELKIPPFPNCSLGDLCQQKISELNGKFTSSKEVLMLALGYYILILSTHPYIFNLIRKKLFDISTLTTVPSSEKGNDILNALHPLYHCKRITKMPISSFFEEKNEGICNIYTNENGELFLQIEKCTNNNLIKYDINPGPNALEHSLEIEKLINLLSNAVNGIKEGNNDRKNDNENLLIIKNIGARTVAIRNMILIKNYSQGFFINFIKKELHKYSEKYIIKKISSEFFNIISRNYLDKVILDRNSNFCSIIYNIQKKQFKCYWLDSNYRTLYGMVLEYLWKNDKFSDTSLNETLCLSREIDEFKKVMMIHRPKIIVIDVSNLECYKMINCIRSKFRDCNLVYSDYISKICKIKFVEITPEYEMKQAIDQVRYVVHPVNQIIDLWSYKYEENLLLNLSFHQLQENIKDIPLLNYSLENQIIRVVNSRPIVTEDLSKYSYKLFNFICGFGPSSSSYIIDNINEPENIKISLRGKNPIIYQNINQFIKEDISSKNTLYDIKNQKNNIGLKKSEVFYSMINDPIYFKKNCLCNAIVSDIDQKGKVVNCILLRDSNDIKAILKFDNIDQNITNYQSFFYPQRIILCKIIDIILRHHSYEIILSNKNEDLKSVKDFLTENKNLKYNNNNDDKDFTIKEIRKLEEIQQTDQKNQTKTLKYYPINMENEQFLMNANYANMKRFFQSYRSVEYKIRPSFLGENHLTLTLKVIEDIYLNYDIEIIKVELDNYNMNNEKTYVTNYKIEDVSYKSLNELVDIFAIKILKKIKDFKKSENFFPPADIRNLFFQIFNIKSNIVPNEKKNETKNKMKDYDYNKDKDDIVKRDDIILGFMKESPEYGILFTKASNEYNYTIDFIRILYNGYLFHGRLFNFLHDIINFYKDYHNTNHYQNFIKRQFICNIHAQIEEIDEKYIEFEGTKPNLEKYYQNDAVVRQLKDGLLYPDNTYKEFIGKKRKADNDTNDVWEQMDSNNAWDNNGENNVNSNENDNGVWGKPSKNSKNNNKLNPNFNMNNNNEKNKNKNKNNNFNKSKNRFNGNKRFSQNNNNNNIEPNNDPWDNSNNNNNDSWNINNNNAEANDDVWTNSNNNNELNFNNWKASNNNNNDDWIDNSSNNNNKNIWGKSNKPKKNMENSNKDDNNWGSQNNNDDWANSNNTDSWGSSNKNNNNSINNSTNKNSWENSNNASAWDNPKIEDKKGINNSSWDNDDKNNDDWANSQNNKNDKNTRNNPKKKKFNKGNNQNNQINKASNFSWEKKGNSAFDWKNQNDEEKEEENLGSNTNKNNSDTWENPSNNNNNWENSNANNNKNSDWGSSNNDSNSNWGSSNNDSNSNWGNNNKKTNNNRRKTDYNNNKAKDTFGNSNNSNSNNNWGNNNNANADDWGNANNTKGNDGWGNNNNTNSGDNWDNRNKNKEEDIWKSSNNSNEDNNWGNSNNNKDKSNLGNSNNSNADKGWGNENNNESWNKPNNNYNNSKRNKDNNFRKNNNNNNSWNNNNNNDTNNFSQRNNNKNFNKFQNNKNKNFNNRKNNNNTWNNNNNYNKDNNQNSNFIGWNIKKEPEDFGEFDNNNSRGRGGNRNHNKNARKINWANTENNDIDIKQEKGEGVIDFEQKDMFGGYNVEGNNE